MDERIPPALYIAVAELLAWLYRIESDDESNASNATNASDAPH
jgi:type III secretion system FlhB-like substrate exporter